MKCLSVDETVAQLKLAYKGVPDEIREHFDNCKECQKTQGIALEKLLNEARQKDGFICTPYVEYKTCDKCGQVNHVYYLTIVPMDCPYLWLCAECFRGYRKLNPRPSIKIKNVIIHGEKEIEAENKRLSVESN